MWGHIIKDDEDRKVVEGAGWKPVQEELRVRLLNRGHSKTVTRFYEQAAAHFALWAAKRNRHRSEITNEEIARFLSQHLPRCHCKIGGVRRWNLVHAGLGHVKTVLDAGGYRSVKQKGELSAIDREVHRFDEHLHAVAGLQETTRRNRRLYLREFLIEVFGNREPEASSITPRMVIAYMNKCARQGRSGIKDIASCLRSYFRFLQLRGEGDESLALSVPTPSNQTSATLPTILSDDKLIRLLAIFDRSTAVGCRDYAITRCLMDLGLRPLEVANLRIEDIDWRKATIRIMGNKSRRNDELPLPSSTGKALAEYLSRVRPKKPPREVFLHINAPFEGIARQTVSGVVRRAAIRAGIKTTIGARTLRQTTATRLLRRGASLKEVADVLRHRCLDTTTRYATVDLSRLEMVAAPWPKGERG